MSDFTTNFKRLRLVNHLTLDELAENINKMTGAKYSKGTLSRWESGTAPTMDSARDVAMYFGVTIDELLGITITTTDSPLSLIPILATITSGVPIFEESNIIGYGPRPIQGSTSQGLFYLSVNDECAYGEFPKGSLCLVDRDADHKSGDIVVLMINRGDGVVRRVDFTDDHIVVIPLAISPACYAQSYDLETNEITIIGKVIGSYRSYL